MCILPTRISDTNFHEILVKRQSYLIAENFPRLWAHHSSQTQNAPSLQAGQMFDCMQVLVGRADPIGIWRLIILLTDNSVLTLSRRYCATDMVCSNFILLNLNSYWLFSLQTYNSWSVAWNFVPITRRTLITFAKLLLFFSVSQQQTRNATKLLR